MNERMTKRDADEQAMMDCEKCKADWTGKHGKPMADCTALYCRNRLLDRLVAYEDTGLTPEEIKAPFTEDTMINLAAQALGVEPSRLRKLAEADKDGRVLILPCKVGDTVWFKTYKNNARDCIGVQPHEVTRISASIIVPGEIVDIGIPVDQIGVRVFLSETEAVAADAKPPAGNSILEV